MILRQCHHCPAQFTVVGEHSTRKLCPECWNANQRATAAEQARLSESEADRLAPSEAEIAAMTADIRKGWTLHDYYKRSGVTEPRVETEVVPSEVFTG